jgi:hypothetical protein
MSNLPSYDITDLISFTERPDGSMEVTPKVVLREVEAGSDEERELRALWMSRMMFGALVDMHEDRAYESWLEAAGVRLV